MTDIFRELRDAIIFGNTANARELTEKALEAKTDPQEIIKKSVVPAMEIVGNKFENSEYYLPEMMSSGQAAKAGLGLLRPLLAGSSLEPVAIVAIGSVKGDLHDIGKNLVATMLEGAGFEVIDLGVDVPPEKFVDCVKNRKANIVGLSALLTTTMPMMQTTIEVLVNADIRDDVKVMVGGPGITGGFAEMIGADGYAPDASAAVRMAKGLLDPG